MTENFFIMVTIFIKPVFASVELTLTPNPNTDGDTNPRFGSKHDQH